MGCLLQVVCFIVADKINSTCWSSLPLNAILDRYDKLYKKANLVYYQSNFFSNFMKWKSILKEFEIAT